MLTRNYLRSLYPG